MAIKWSHDGELIDLTRYSRLTFKRYDVEKIANDIASELGLDTFPYEDSFGKHAVIKGKGIWINIQSFGPQIIANLATDPQYKKEILRKLEIHGIKYRRSHPIQIISETIHFYLF